MTILRPLGAYGLILFVAALPLLGQSTSGNISGRVSDPTQAAVPGAEIVVKNADTGLELRAESNPEGLFTFSLLPPGG